MTYLKYHMVSYYTEVDTMLVDRSLAAEYRREVRDGETPVLENASKTGSIRFSVPVLSGLNLPICTVLEEKLSFK